MTNNKKLAELKKLEEYFFKDMKDLVIIDLNAKVYSFSREKALNPKF